MYFMFYDITIDISINNLLCNTIMKFNIETLKNN